MGNFQRVEKGGEAQAEKSSLTELMKEEPEFGLLERLEFVYQRRDSEASSGLSTRG